MKKILLTAGVVVIMALIMVSMASANGGPHGGYTATTSACAGCHRAHTAVGPKLLVQSSTYALCESCHNGSGATTDVWSGAWLTGENPTSLLGGGFDTYGGEDVSSKHDADATTAASWGNGVARGLTGALSANLDCASCHDPHGSPNYRIIKATVNGVAVSVAQVDEGAKDYDTEQWGTGQSSVCAACHGAYHRTNANQGSTLDGGSYTHRIDMSYAYGSNANPETVGMGGFKLPLAQSGTGAGKNIAVCQTCHLPHGTAATMGGFALGAGPSLDSALLRLDNRGVCEVCHQK